MNILTTSSVARPVIHTRGQITEMLYGPSGNNGVKTNVYSTTNQQLLATTAGTTADTVVWQSFAYTYDNNANITRIVDATNANQVQCFTYDALDRLTSGFTDNTTTCNGHTPTGDGNYDETYTFNAAGDITSKTGQGTYTYNDPDHAHAVTSTSTGSTFTYNDDGDMVSRKTGNGPLQTLTWNMEERLETVTENGTTSTYLYAENGARTRTNTGNDYTYYHGNTEYRHNTSTNTSLWTYAHTFGGQTVAVTVDGDTSWLFTDQIGSNSLAVTETGAVSVQRYTPWGETRVDGGLPTQRGYTGQIEDKNTGLSYYNARYYDPTIGRFISPDTIIPNASDSQSYNRYAYVRNNPINYNDPTGHEDNYIGVCPPGDPGCRSAMDAKLIGMYDSICAEANFQSCEPDSIPLVDSVLAPISPIDTGSPMSDEPIIPGARECSGLLICYWVTFDPFFTSQTKVGLHQTVLCEVNPIDCVRSTMASREAVSVAHEYFPGKENRGKRNAFQHSYWHALMVFQGVDDPLAFGLAHELDIHNGSGDTQKDILNNQQGVLVGEAGMTKAAMQVMLISAANNGYLACMNDVGLISGCGS